MYVRLGELHGRVNPKQMGHTLPPLNRRLFHPLQGLLQVGFKRGSAN
jgi:hypothetical protein